MIQLAVTRYWAIGSILTAAVLNFAVAIATGSLTNMVACLACMVGLAGVVKLVN